jgi:hypothetical protein
LRGASCKGEAEGEDEPAKLFQDSPPEKKRAYNDESRYYNYATKNIGIIPFHGKKKPLSKIMQERGQFKMDRNRFRFI